MGLSGYNSHEYIITKIIIRKKALSNKTEFKMSLKTRLAVVITVMCCSVSSANALELTV